MRHFAHPDVIVIELRGAICAMCKRRQGIEASGGEGILDRQAALLNTRIQELIWAAEARRGGRRGGRNGQERTEASVVTVVIFHHGDVTVGKLRLEVKS